MSNNSFYFNQKASDDFNKAKSRATISSVLNALTPERQQLLSLEDVKKLIKPKSETYIGMKTVPVDLIVGSEGRYKDFTKAFLPKKNSADPDGKTLIKPTCNQLFYRQLSCTRLEELILSGMVIIEYRWQRHRGSWILTRKLFVLTQKLNLNQV